MASKNEEYIAVAAVLITLVILSIFFGVFWSFLLVFTFLVLAYLSRRPQTKKKIVTKKYKIKQESLDNPSDNSEYLTNDAKEMDVPFTGLPSPKFPTQTLRSPMPLLSSLSTVTKRLSFNVSSLSSPDGQVYMLGNANRRFNTTIGSPRQSLKSPITSPQSPPKYFSLLNPSLQQPSTVKIATPKINNETIIIDEPKKSTDSPLSRATILSALKQSTIRKRSVVEDEDGIDDVSSPVENHKKKRRYHYPSGNENEKSKPFTDTTDLEITRDVISDPPAVTRKSTGIYSLIQARLKRRPLHNVKDTTEEGEVMLKKTRQDYDRTAELSKVTEATDSECKPEGTRDVQMTASTVNTNERITSKNSYDDDNDSGCDADDDDDIVMKSLPSTKGAQRLSKKQAQKLAEKRKRIDMKASSTPSHTPETSASSHTPSHTPDVTASREQRLSKKQRVLNTPTASEITTTSTNDSPVSEKSDVSAQEMSPRKRFTVIRFPSKKDDLKRRPVPVYCASVNSPDLPKRRSVTHKITKEDIELDRKMAWQRVQSLLDGSDDEEEEKEKEKSKGTSPSIAIHVTTCMPSPSRSQTTTVTTASGIPSVSTVVPGKSTEGQATAVGTTLSTSAPSTGTTQPSTLLSALAANKPSGTTPIASVPTQSTTLLPGTADPKSSMFFKVPSTTSMTGLPSSLTSTSQTSSTQSFSFTASTSNATGVSSATTTASAPVKNLFGASTADPTKTTSLTSFTTSSQSIQTPICTPVAQALLSTKPSNTTPGLPTMTAPASALNFGSTAMKQPQVGINTSSNLPQNFNLPQTASSSNLTTFIAPSNPPQTGPSVPSSLPGFNVPGKMPQPGVGTTSGLASLSATSNLPQPGLSTAGSLPKFGFGATAAAGTTSASVTTAVTSSMFAGLNANTAGSTLPGAMRATTQASQPGFTAPGFSLSASTAPKTTAQPNTFSFGISQQSTAPKTTAQASTFSFNANQQTAAPKTTTQASTFGFNANQQTVASKTTSQASTFSFSANQKTAAPSPFGSQPGTTNNASTAPKTTSQTNTFSFGVNQQTAAPSPFGSQQQPTTKSFGSTTPSNVFGVKPSTTSSTPAFGFPSSSSQKTFGNTGAKATPGGFEFGTNTGTPSAFGSTTQQPAANNPPSGQFSFSAGASGTPNQAQNKPGFSFAAGANPASTSQPIGAPSSASTFGTPGANTNVFGGTQPAFGATTNQGVFGSPATNTPSNQKNQNAFGSTSQSTFGSPAPQGVFGNPVGSSSAGGFSFGGGGSSSTPSGGGFKFGAAASSGFQSTPNAAPTFGSTPSAAPGASAGGFNFGAGSSTGTPTFGAATPNTGGFKFGSGAQTASSQVAKPRPKATAVRRRGRKP